MLLVKIQMVFLKLTVLPLESVRRPSLLKIACQPIAQFSFQHMWLEHAELTLASVA